SSFTFAWISFPRIDLSPVSGGEESLVVLLPCLLTQKLTIETRERSFMPSSFSREMILVTQTLRLVVLIRGFAPIDESPTRDSTALLSRIMNRQNNKALEMREPQ